MIMLISKNYHLWIKELKKLIEQHRVWSYVDSNENKSELIIEKLSNFFDYTISLQESVIVRSEVFASNLIKSTRSINELTENQQKNLHQRQFTWSMREKAVKRIKKEIQIIYQAVKTSARQYISSNKMRSSIKNILKTLQKRYKLSNVKIVEMLHNQYHALKIPFVKTKIEHWISEWKNLRSKMINQEIKDTFDNDAIFVHEFLRASKKWASIFCETWAIQHQTVKKDLNFFKTIRVYRNAYENFLRNNKSVDRDIVEKITLQEIDQNDANLQIDSKNDKQNDGQNDKEKTCVYDQVHLFKKCLYIVSENRKSR
jgi:hypothetical protein